MSLTSTTGMFHIKISSSYCAVNTLGSPGLSKRGARLRSLCLIMLSQNKERFWYVKVSSGCTINPLKPELNPICYLLALLGAHHFIHVRRIRVKLLILR